VEFENVSIDSVIVHESQRCRAHASENDRLWLNDLQIDALSLYCGSAVKGKAAVSIMEYFL
jgi:hypothetical protein